MITYLAGIIRANKVFKYSVRLSQELVKLLLETNQCLGDEDNIYLAMESFAFSAFCSDTQYSRTVLNRQKLYGTIYEVALSRLSGWLCSVFIKAGTSTEVAKSISEQFKNDTREYGISWNRQLAQDHPSKSRNENEVFELGLSRFIRNVLSWSQTKAISLPVDFDEKLREIVFRTLMEANLFTELTEKHQS